MRLCQCVCVCVGVGVCVPECVRGSYYEKLRSFTALLWRNKSAVESVFTLRTNAK